MPCQQRTSHNLPLPRSTYTEVKRQDGGGDGDGDVLGEDGQPDHVVPGPHVHQPAQGVTEQQQGQTAHQTVDRHQLETERRSNTACYTELVVLRLSPAVQLEHEESSHELPGSVPPGRQGSGEIEREQ